MGIDGARGGRRGIDTGPWDVREGAGPYGTELRCEVLGEDLTTARQVRTSFSVFGCDGPGWVLRAVAGGVGADRGPADWAYAFFAGTVVAPSAVPVAVPASPAGFGSFQPGLHLEPVLLRLPDGDAPATTTGPLRLGDRWW
ncbi:DUF3710 domain-containing protein [Kitasatospora sp. NPDC001540]|uniref:DUF3710 domain-containing protein n=1 Tax=Kitasatospora sp. NPDC001540 TaxID=3364014 RepID=UPI00368C6C55